MAERGPRTSPRRTVTVSADVGAGPERVWDAIMDAQKRRSWWPQMIRIDAALDGRFEERWSSGEREVVTAGTVAACEPPRHLELRWADDDWPAETRVAIDVRPASSGGATVTVRQEGWEALPDGDALAAAHERGWAQHLDALRRFAEQSTTRLGPSPIAT